MGTFPIDEDGIPGDSLKKFIVYNGDNQAEYVCEAKPGSSKSDAVWRIFKIVYDGNGNATDIQWANGTKSFDKVANDYASYNYS